MTRSYDEYARDISKAGNRGLHREVQALSTRFAKDAQRSAKARAQRRFNPGTGNLRRSIKGSPVIGLQKLGFELMAGSSLVQYAGIQEFGGLTGRNRSTRIRGRRYLRDTIEEFRKRLPRALNKALRTSIDFQGTQ